MKVNCTLKMTIISHGVAFCYGSMPQLHFTNSCFINKLQKKYSSVQGRTNIPNLQPRVHAYLNIVTVNISLIIIAKDNIWLTLFTLSSYKEKSIVNLSAPVNTKFNHIFHLSMRKITNLKTFKLFAILFHLEYCWLWLPSGCLL